MHFVNSYSRKPYEKKLGGTELSSITEYEIVSRVSYRLTQAAEQKTQDYQSFVHAVCENRRMWQIMSIDLASDKNRLPRELRAQLLALGQFVVTESTLVLKGAKGVATLIEINTAILRGLRYQAAPNSQAPEAARCQA